MMDLERAIIARERARVWRANMRQTGWSLVAVLLLPVRFLRRIIPDRLKTLEGSIFLQHVILTGIIGVWAVVLALPWPTFPTGKGYSRFAEIMPDERYWSAAFGLCTTLAVFGCVFAWPGRRYDEWRIGDRTVRVASGCFLGASHALIAKLSIEGNPVGTGYIYAFVALAAFMLMFAEIERS